MVASFIIYFSLFSIDSNIAIKLLSFPGFVSVTVNIFNSLVISFSRFLAFTNYHGIHIWLFISIVLPGFHLVYFL